MDQDSHWTQAKQVKGQARCQPWQELGNLEKKKKRSRGGLKIESGVQGAPAPSPPFLSVPPPSLPPPPLPAQLSTSPLITWMPLVLLSHHHCWVPYAWCHQSHTWGICNTFFQGLQPKPQGSQQIDFLDTVQFSTVSRVPASLSKHATIFFEALKPRSRAHISSPEFAGYLRKYSSVQWSYHINYPPLTT